MDLLTIIALGSYPFTVGAYLFVWRLGQVVASLRLHLAEIKVRLENHVLHELDTIKRRLDDLERR